MFHIRMQNFISVGPIIKKTGLKLDDPFNVFVKFIRNGDNYLNIS